MTGRTSISLLAACATILAASPVASAAPICASRIYDYLTKPVTEFAIDFHQNDLISDDLFARYRAELTAAGAAFGYDPAATGFTLHEGLSTFPFLFYGRILSVVFVLCEAGRERDNICRRADYYLLDGVIDADRLALLLADTIVNARPAPVASCDFGRGDWSDLD